MAASERKQAKQRQPKSRQKSPSSLSTKKTKSSDKNPQKWIKFAGRIERLAAEKGGLYALAEASGVSKSSLYKSQKDADYSPGMEVLHKLIEATGCDPAWLLTGTGEPFPPVSPASTEGVEQLDSARQEALRLIEQTGNLLAALAPILPTAARDEIITAIEKVAAHLRRTLTRAEHGEHFPSASADDERVVEEK